MAKLVAPGKRWRPVMRPAPTIACAPVRVPAGCTVAIVVMIVAWSGCSASRAEPTAPGPGRDDAPWQEGIASWYGPGLDGRRTASGEVFDQDALTAAHPSLPFGTRVRVVNTQNGRDVIVRINDRGPFTRNRIIDLSRGAARVLDMIVAGTVQVRIYVIETTWPDQRT